MESIGSKVFFLEDEEYALLAAILGKLDPELLNHVTKPGVLTRSDVKKINSLLLGTEFVYLLDDDWNPTKDSLEVEKLADSIREKWIKSRNSNPHE